MKKLLVIPVFALCVYLLPSCSCSKKPSAEELQTRLDSFQTALDTLAREKANTKAYLDRFDSLDFVYYNGQQWDKFAISHDPGVQVYYPDGTMSLGLSPNHIEQLTPLFAMAPDTKITNHRVKFGGDDWTAVIGEIQGTFTDTMRTPFGKVVPPTGKPFKFMMATISHWKDGKMTDEYLFWDNHLFMKQIGLVNE
jgi:hypothetical protein